MKVLGLDIGDRRIGLALSGPTGTLASPLGFVERTTLKRDVARILKLAQEHGAERIVAGLPLSLGGRAGPQAQKVLAFLRRLESSTDLPVETADERYSTAEAERLLRQRGVQPSREKGRTDAAAAAIILQDYLDQRTASSP